MELIKPEYSLIIWGIFTIILLFIWILAIASILQSDFKDARAKSIWMLVIIFLPVIGSLLYFLIGRGQRINNI